MRRQLLVILTGLALLTTGLVLVLASGDTAPAPAAPTASPRPVITSEADLKRSQQEVRDTKIDSEADLKQNERDASGL